MGFSRIYNLNQRGVSLYHFFVDSNVQRILPTKDKLNNIIVFLCKDPFKVSVNLNNEPMSMSTSSFPFHGINNWFAIDKEIFFAGSKGNLIICEQSMKKFRKAENRDLNAIISIQKWKNYYLILCDDNMLFFTEINGEVIKVLFGIHVGNLVPSLMLIK